MSHKGLTFVEMSGKTHRFTEGKALGNSKWDVRSVDNFTSDCLALIEVM